MRAYTVEDLMLKVRQRTDQETSSFISDAELMDYIDGSFADFYDQITGLYEQYNLTYATIVTTQDTQIYNLPANFYKAQGIETSVSGGRKVSLNRFEWADRNNAVDDYGQVSDVGTNIEYNIMGNTIMFNPQPQPGLEVTVWYTPVAPKLISKSQIVDGVNGWEELIIADACIKVYEKQEADPGVFQAQKKRMIERMQEMGQNRDAVKPRKVSDARGLYTGGGYFFGRRF